MRRSVTNMMITRPSTRVTTRFEGIVLASIAHGAVPRSSVNGTPEDDQYVGMEAKGGFT